MSMRNCLRSCLRSAALAAMAALMILLVTLLTGCTPPADQAEKMTSFSAAERAPSCPVERALTMSPGSF